MAALNQQIVSAVRGGMSVGDAAEYFGKSRAAIYAILRREGYKKSSVRDERTLAAQQMVKVLPSSPDMSVEEIAREMKMSVWEVEQLLSSAMEKIRRILLKDEKLREEWTLQLWHWDEDDKWARVI